MADAACLGLLVLCATPAPAQRPTLAFRNDTQIPLLVEGRSIINNQLRRQVFLVRPGETWHGLLIAPGDKLIIIADARQPTRFLYRERKYFGPGNAFFAIQHVPHGNPRPVLPLKLVPIPPPSPPRRGEPIPPPTPTPRH